MKVAKVMVLVGGFVGLFGLDRPLLEVDSAENGFTLSISALRGVYFTAADEVKSRLRESGLSGSVEDELQRSFQAHPAFVHSRRAEAYVMTLAMLPGFLILFGLRALKGFGRGLGFLCLFLGLAQLSLVAITYALSNVISNQLTSDAVHLGTAVYCVLGSGISGCLGGLGALVRPEEGKG
jgi:hypothetical protein